MNKKYIVRLSDEERSVCHEIIKKLKGSSQRFRRAQILLKADADGPGWTDAKIAKADVTSRAKEIKNDRDARDELAVLKQWLELAETQTELKRAIKDMETSLDKLAYEQYARLSIEEIQTLVIHDKWMTQLSASVTGELDRVSQTLTGRIRQLAERYATPLPQLLTEVESLEAKVADHLKKMGAVL
jgi:type I restriction enzyme M protein